MVTVHYSLWAKGTQLWPLNWHFEGHLIPNSSFSIENEIGKKEHNDCINNNMHMSQVTFLLALIYDLIDILKANFF